jgi:chaperonin GroEL (HSP60 family)
MISDAFTNVFKRVLNNKYDDNATVDDVVSRVMNEYKESGKQIGYDLTTDNFSNDIINSCRTDIEILRGAFSVISLLITSNQYIAINAYAQQNK